MNVIAEMNILRSRMVISSVKGDYKNFKKASKDYAHLAVANFDLAKSSSNTAPRVSVPLFSLTGLRMVKVWLLNKFRVKTPDEKLLNQMVKEEKINQAAEKLLKGEKWR